MNTRNLLVSVSLLALGAFVVLPAAASVEYAAQPLAAKAIATMTADDSADGPKNDDSPDKGDLGLAAPAPVVVADDSADGAGDSSSTSSDRGSSDRGSADRGSDRGSADKGSDRGGKGSGEGHGDSGHSPGHSGHSSRG